jgi:hypothetical protein
MGKNKIPPLELETDRIPGIGILEIRFLGKPKLAMVC